MRDHQAASSDREAMKLSRVRRRCEARLRTIDLPDPFDVRAFCDALAQRRSRPIKHCPINTKTGPCGLWVAMSKTDYIFYERDTTPVHQQHIVLHEAGHILCEHDGSDVLDVELAQLLLPGISPELVKRILGRRHYSERDEAEAEMVACLLAERVRRRPPEATWTAPPEVAGVVDRLSHSLERTPPEDRR